jgi:DNA-binding MarR family transcriptional regulator
MEKEVHIGRKIGMLSRKIHRRIDKEASQYGLTDIQAKILAFVHCNSHKKDIFQKDIEEEFGIRRSSVTSVLQLMEKNGYIKRISVLEDARLKKIILTEKGAEIQENVYKFILKFERSLQDELTEDEFNILISIIEKLSKKISD